MKRRRIEYFLEPILLVAFLLFVCLMALVLGKTSGIFWNLMAVLGCAIALFGVVRLVRFLLRR